MDQSVIEFIVNCLLFFCVFKLGQISVYYRVQSQSVKPQPEIKVIRRQIDIEEINGVYYAYDGNDFLAQATTPDELGQMIAAKFPDKYKRAKISIKS